MDFDMLDVVDLTTRQQNLQQQSQQPPKPRTRFPPKLKLKPEPEPEPEPLLQPKPEPTSIMMVEKEDLMEVEEEKEDGGVDDVAVIEEEVEEEEEEDVVVREIDVFFNPGPIEEDTDLYVMQYPLRPSWRPYDLDERCLEVRIKPKSLEVEIDLSMKSDDNFNRGKDGKMWAEKQTLSSRRCVSRTGCAVGLLKGNKLYVNPVRAVLQLRPSTKHLFGEEKFEEKSEGSSKMENQPKIHVVPNVPVEKESWVPLKYHGMSSPFSSRYRQKMASEETSPIQFSMSEYDYINSLCPSLTMANEKRRVDTRRRLLLLPLAERFKQYFKEEKSNQVHRFSVLEHFAPDESVEDILNVLKKNAELVQGSWVPVHTLFGFSREMQVIREYFLIQFSKGNLISNQELQKLPFIKPVIMPVVKEDILKPLAKYSDFSKKWKFRESEDVMFLKSYPDTANKFKRHWETREEIVNNTLPSRTGKTGTVNKFEGGKKSKTEVSANAICMSQQTREALPKAIEEIIRTHKVCSLQLIQAGLRETILSNKNNPKVDGKTVVEPVQDICTQPEFQTIICQVAEDIHGQYVLKSSGSSALCSLRSVVIKLLRERGPNAKLTKVDVINIAKIKLKKEFTASEFTEVMNELCVSVKGQWVIKSGDGKSL